MSVALAQQLAKGSEDNNATVSASGVSSIEPGQTGRNDGVVELQLPSSSVRSAAEDALRRCEEWRLRMQSQSPGGEWPPTQIDLALLADSDNLEKAVDCLEELVAENKEKNTSSPSRPAEVDPIDRGFELYCEAHGIDLRDNRDEEEAEAAQEEREFAEEVSTVATAALLKAEEWRQKAETVSAGQRRRAAGLTGEQRRARLTDTVALQLATPPGSSPPSIAMLSPQLERCRGDNERLREMIAALEAKDGEMEAKLIETIIVHRKRAETVQETLLLERKEWEGHRTSLQQGHERLMASKAAENRAWAEQHRVRADRAEEALERERRGWEDHKKHVESSQARLIDTVGAETNTTLEQHNIRADRAEAALRREREEWGQQRHDLEETLRAERAAWEREREAMAAQQTEVMSLKERENKALLQRITGLEADTELAQAAVQASAAAQARSPPPRSPPAPILANPTLARFAEPRAAATEAVLGVTSLPTEAVLGAEETPPPPPVTLAMGEGEIHLAELRREAGAARLGEGKEEEDPLSPSWADGYHQMALAQFPDPEVLEVSEVPETEGQLEAREARESLLAGLAHEKRHEEAEGLWGDPHRDDTDALAASHVEDGHYRWQGEGEGPTPHDASGAESETLVGREMALVDMASRGAPELDGAVVRVLEQHIDRQHWIVTLVADPSLEPEKLGIAPENLSPIPEGGLPPSPEVQPFQIPPEPVALAQQDVSSAVTTPGSTPEEQILRMWCDSLQEHHRLLRAGARKPEDFPRRTQGWLYKKAGGGIASSLVFGRTNWSKRWFVLEAGKFSYFKNEVKRGARGNALYRGDLAKAMTDPDGSLTCKVFYDPRKNRLMLDVPFGDRTLRIGTEDKVSAKDVPWHGEPEPGRVAGAGA